MHNQAQVANAVKLTLAVASSEIAAQKDGAKLSAAIAELFTATNGNEGEFFAVFGNGEKSKSKRIDGEYLSGVKSASAKMAKDKKERILAIVRQRLYEARKLRSLGGFPSKDETLQAALKRYSPAKEKDAKPEGNASTAVTIADNASLDDIADALSVWVAKHGAASAGLVAKLADFLPVSVKRQRKVA